MGKEDGYGEGGHTVGGPRAGTEDLAIRVVEGDTAGRETSRGQRWGMGQGVGTEMDKGQRGWGEARQQKCVEQVAIVG